MNADKERREYERQRAWDYMMQLPRDVRNLKVYGRDFPEYLKSAEWMQTPEARKVSMKVFDFMFDFCALKKDMAQYRWSKEFLAENGVDFTSAKKLFFAILPTLPEQDRVVILSRMGNA
jgi:hypothetical protein